MTKTAKTIGLLVGLWVLGGPSSLSMAQTPQIPPTQVPSTQALPPQAPLPLPVAPPAEATIHVAVDSPAFAFSPANWSGDAGRGGRLYRQTWNAGAYFSFHWTSDSPNPTATLLLDTSTYGTTVPTKPLFTYNVDGVWTADVPCDGSIALANLAGAGNHVLTVYVQESQQNNRWGTPGVSGSNVVRVAGMQLDAHSTPGRAIGLAAAIGGGSAVGSASSPASGPTPVAPRWILEIGDSITEGIGANGRSDSLSDYSYLVGQAFQTQGYEYGVSACGYSGWLRKGDASGDVPAYYVVSGSANGHGGTYNAAESRWNKIDANTSLLDSRGHLSAYGPTGQEPAAITLNYGTNDGLNTVNPSDLRASITQSLAALREAAPQACLFVIIPFGQFEADALRDGVAAYQAAHRADERVFVIDCGLRVAKSLAANGYWGGLHPNARAHAALAARIVAAIQSNLPPLRGGP